VNRLFLLLSLAFAVQVAIAKGVYQTPLAFLDQTFNGKVPDVSTVWITKDKKQTISDILQHSPTFIRVKYWQSGTKTAWILNEIGKEKPITIGIVIDSGQIERVKVLEFRESRGWEVKHAFFTRQFNSASLNEGMQLNKSIDGISGATLSVRALKKVARIALYLEQQI